MENINNIDDFIRMDVENSNEKEAMKKVMEAMFAVNDMTLYLDTHPQDRRALDLHNKYVREYENAKKYYENNFGPLSIFKEMNEWKWYSDKWPWEGGMR